MKKQLHREMINVVMELKCINEVKSFDGREVLFKYGYGYPAVVYRDYILQAKAINGSWELVASNEEGDWEKDHWFSNHFEIIR